MKLHMAAGDTLYVHPELDGNLGYWARKWGVSQCEIRDAIIATGQLDLQTLKNFVHRDSWLHHPVEKTFKALRSGFDLLF